MTDTTEGGRGQGRTVPSDLDAERSVLGAMLLSVDARRVARTALLAGDFFHPGYGEIFDAIAGLHDAGEGVDARTVADILKRRGVLDNIGGAGTLVAIQAETPATSNVARYCRIVGEMAALRRVLAVCGDTVTDAYAVPSDIGDFLDRFAAAVASIDVPVVGSERSVTLDRFYDEQVEANDWIIEPFLQRGERIIFVAGEGVGKSTISRQFAVAAAQGVNPFTIKDRIPPIRTLLVDLENPGYIIRKSLDRLLTAAIKDGADSYDGERMRIWHAPAGIDIRQRVDFGRLDAVIEEARPDLICIGPLYKLFRKTKGESDEDAALDVTARLDDLRTRHGCALIIEHHAPKGTGGHREMTPFGSAVWMRWPEFGPAFVQHPKARPGQRSWLAWSHWRGPRDERPWPDEMTWGSVWPWTFHWTEDIEDPTGYSAPEAAQPVEMF